MSPAGTSCFGISGAREAAVGEGAVLSSRIRRRAPLWGMHPAGLPGSSGSSTFTPRAFFPSRAGPPATVTGAHAPATEGPAPATPISRTVRENRCSGGRPHTSGAGPIPPGAGPIPPGAGPISPGAGVRLPMPAAHRSLHISASLTTCYRCAFQRTPCACCENVGSWSHPHTDGPRIVSRTHMRPSSRIPRTVNGGLNQ